MALPAFAQLATLCLNTTCALISLIDLMNQYVLAEATQHFSLLFHSSHDSEDKLWFGYTVFLRLLGLCRSALNAILAQKHLICPESQKLLPLIINDFTKDDGFKNHLFVMSHSSL